MTVEVVVVLGELGIESSLGADAKQPISLLFRQRTKFTFWGTRVGRGQFCPEGLQLEGS